MASASRIMPQQQQQVPSPPSSALKCPRCDSSNTKFCYYNNYSLSQPRHFCKACKRYWTRGGTLRNVPVGGGCRKNKRLKTSTSSLNGGTATATSTPSQNPRQLHNNNPNSNQRQLNNPMFFGVHNANPSALNLQFSSVESSVSGSGLLNLSPPHLDNNSIPAAAALGFSSSDLLLSHISEGFNNSANQIQDISLHSNRFHHPTISFHRNSHLLGNFGAALMMPTKDVKMEAFNRSGQKQTEQIDLSNISDPSHYWTSATAATSNWHDPTNNGSSIASLF